MDSILIILINYSSYSCYCYCYFILILIILILIVIVIILILLLFLFIIIIIILLLLFLFLWSPEFSESVNRRGIHQLAATCKKNTKTTVVFRHPSDDKVSIFSEDLKLGATVISIKNPVPHLV